MSNVEPVATRLSSRIDAAIAELSDAEKSDLLKVACEFAASGFFICEQKLDLHRSKLPGKLRPYLLPILYIAIRDN